MNKFETPDLDGLYHNVISWDYFKDFVDDQVITKHIEEDKTWEDLRDVNPIRDKIEKVPIKFSSIEEYIKIFHTLFMIECKSQLARFKITEKEDSEKFVLNFVNFDQKRKFYTFELLRISTKSLGVSYSNGDFIVIHKMSLTDEYQLEHSLGYVEKFNGSLLICKVDLNIQDPRSLAFAKHITKNSEWFITKICNLATITREYTALLSVDSLKIIDMLIHPGDVYSSLDLQKFYSLSQPDSEFFHIPSRLDNKLRGYFNKSQYDAVKSSVKKKGLTLIQGPPGTGKSTTILGILSVILNSSMKKDTVERKNSVVTMVNKEMLCDVNGSTPQRNHDLQLYPWIFDTSASSDWMDTPQFTIDDIFTFTEFPTSKATDNYKIFSKPIEEDATPPEKILVCAPSNVAIDEIVRKLGQYGLFDSEGNKYHPKFVRIGPNYHPNLKEHSLDYMVSKRLGAGFGYSSEGSSGKDADKIRSEILTQAKIVCSTLSMAGSNILTSFGQKFDTVVIDEASQAVEISTLIPLKYNCERLILVGDPKQLSATVFSPIALKYNYDQSLFKRFQEAGHEVMILKTQYRMHSTISKFISECFYDGMLNDDQSIENHPQEICSTHPAFQPMTFYDFESDEEFIGNSYYNEAQVDIIVELVQILVKIYKDDPCSVVNKLAILSPYSKQVSEIKLALNGVFKDVADSSQDLEIEVNTVDGFQGKEKNIIIFSTVRSRGSKTIGFLSDERRMNVGLSRAKSCLIVVGDSKKLINDKNWDKLVRYSFRKGTFYKVKGKIKDYFKHFEENFDKYCAKDEETFVKLIYSAASGK